jgi:flavin reductase (DIM6/NTAB) family NADH-FMN oxidoreductase RutF
MCHPGPGNPSGAVVAGKPNYLAVACFAVLSQLPPIVSIALYKGHYTVTGIKENETFSVNIPSLDMVEETDYCGMISGHRVDKSKLFDTFYGELKTAPMIRECPLSVECNVSQVMESGNNLIFMGEIVAAYADESVLTDGTPDIRKIDPLILFRTDYRSWHFGPVIAQAYHAGSELIEK